MGYRMVIVEPAEGVLDKLGLPVVGIDRGIIGDEAGKPGEEKYRGIP